MLSNRSTCSTHYSRSVSGRFLILSSFFFSQGCCYCDVLYWARSDWSLPASDLSTTLSAAAGANQESTAHLSPGDWPENCPSSLLALSVPFDLCRQACIYCWQCCCSVSVVGQWSLGQWLWWDGWYYGLPAGWCHQAPSGSVESRLCRETCPWSGSCRDSNRDSVD